MIDKFAVIHKKGRVIFGKQIIIIFDKTPKTNIKFIFRKYPFFRLIADNIRNQPSRMMIKRLLVRRHGISLFVIEVQKIMGINVNYIRIRFFHKVVFDAAVVCFAALLLHFPHMGMGCKPLRASGFDKDNVILVKIF